MDAMLEFNAHDLAKMKLALAHADTALAGIRATDLALMQRNLAAAVALPKIDAALLQRNLAAAVALPKIDAALLQRSIEAIRHAATGMGQRIHVRPLAERMATRSDLRDAAHYLLQAEELHEESEDERDSPRVIHDAVGALEELVCHLAGMPTKTMDPAVGALIRRKKISRDEGEMLLSVYRIRSETRGAAHGAGRAPKMVAHFVLFRVQQGVRLLLDRFDIGQADR